MAAAAGQAAGLAVGAAVGAIAGGPAGATAGAQIGVAGAGFLQQRKAGQVQDTLDTAALRLNQEQARTVAAEKSAIHAANFRKALASTVAFASLRGGAGSVARQFGQESVKSFLEDQKAIESGLQISEAQTDISRANLSAKSTARNITNLSRFAQSAFSGVNLNLLKPREKKE